jgi:hypothetical protein
MRGYSHSRCERTQACSCPGGVTGARPISRLSLRIEPWYDRSERPLARAVSVPKDNG